MAAAESCCRCGHEPSIHGRRGARSCRATEPDTCSCAGYRPTKRAKQAPHPHRRWVYTVGYTAHRHPDGYRETALTVTGAPRRYWAMGCLNDWLFGVCGGWATNPFEAIDRWLDDHRETCSFRVAQKDVEAFSEWRGWGKPYWFNDEEDEHPQQTGNPEQ